MTEMELASASRYELWRQDDNGNRFLMDDAPTQEQAQELLNVYEKRRYPHKQTYEIKAVTGA